MTLTEAIQTLRAARMLSSRESDLVADAIEGLCVAYNGKTRELADLERQHAYDINLYTAASEERDAAVKKSEQQQAALGEATAVMMRHSKRPRNCAPRFAKCARNEIHTCATRHRRKRPMEISFWTPWIFVAFVAMWVVLNAPSLMAPSASPEARIRAVLFWAVLVALVVMMLVYPNGRLSS